MSKYPKAKFDRRRLLIRGGNKPGNYFYWYGIKAWFLYGVLGRKP